ncbi:MAG: hypothetical protein ACOCRK_09510 [bacterium]
MTSTELKQIIKRDKHTLIEGKIAEFLFFRDAYPEIERKGSGISLNWWVVPYNNKYIFLKYMPENYKLNENDKIIFDRLNKCNMEYYQMFIKDNEFLLLDRNFEVYTENDFLKLLKLNKNDPYNAWEINIKRQKRAISFLEKNHLLYEFAMERYIANYFLSSIFRRSWNIDAFIIINKEIKIIEVKFKYPASNNCYGMNFGQANLFRNLLTTCFDGLGHYILLNRTYNNKVTILDIINDNIQTSWWTKEINARDIQYSIDNKVGFAPSKTQLTAQREMRVVYFSKYEFDKFKDLGEDVYKL